MMAGMVDSITLGATTRRAKIVCGLDWSEFASTQWLYRLSQALLLLTLPKLGLIIARFWFKVETWKSNRKAAP
ncbi:hypothetical protein AXF42_Ash021533 [Apostasia shenzhenica]|uniref:Uncharacterized protein n=1 Tax=Apostasia shenzhenica TaxID=1088818 RepID=A0A2H9ZT22_9ASPA|nr:hypothetical protein AXF42_Ash021533 [Apostasia shenzhenica]